MTYTLGSPNFHGLSVEVSIDMGIGSARSGFLVYHPDTGRYILCKDLKRRTIVVEYKSYIAARNALLASELPNIVIIKW